MAKYTVKLSGTGVEMPLLGLGTYKSGEEDLDEAVEAALRSGCRLVDCAALYGNEAAVGAALRRAFARGVATRADVFVVSKLWNTEHAPAAVAAACRRSVEALGVGPLDLYLVHWPVCYEPGQRPADVPAVPLAETWAAMERLVDDGLVRHIGTSNFTCRQLDALLAHARIPPAVNQVEFHPLLQQRVQRAFCAAHGIALMGYRPLGNNSSPRRGADTPDVLQLPAVRAVAERHGATPAQAVLAWAVRAGVSVVPQSVHPARIAENMASLALADALDDDDIRAIDALDAHIRTCGSVYYVGRSESEFWDGE